MAWSALDRADSPNKKCPTYDTALPAESPTIAFHGIRGTRRPVSRVILAVLATALAAATVGCGLVNKARDLADTAKVLSDFADRLGKASQLTYTADYQVTGGSTVTLVQQPPNSAFLTKSGRFIVTSDFIYLCGTTNGATTCQKAPHQSSGVNAGDGGLVEGITGRGFITPEMAVGLIAAAAFAPGASVSQSEKIIAGEHSLCATATGLDSAASPGASGAPRDFTVCLTDEGILSSFSGTDTSGQTVEIQLTRYSAEVDQAAFAPPAGATVTNVNQIELSK
jgi:hypothetical protein